MTDIPPPMGPALPPDAPPKRPWVKIALAVSVALNLGVVGVVAGAAIKANRSDGMRQPVVRELNFGPFTAALTRPQRRDMLRDFARDAPRLRDMRAQIGGEFEAILVAVRAEPFDPEALTAALAAQSASTTARLEAGRKSLQSVIEAMTPEDRAAYADRLENGLRHRRPGEGGREGGRESDRERGPEGTRQP